MPNTVKLHRVFKTKPGRLYKAFLDPQAMVKWLPPHGFTAKVDHLDARVGGTYYMSFTNFGTGSSHSFGGEYLELVPGKKIVDKNRLWKDVLDKHASERFNLLLMGGDQIYSDSMWAVVPELKAWSELNWAERKNAKFEPMRRAVHSDRN